MIAGAILMLAITVHYGLERIAEAIEQGETK